MLNLKKILLLLTPSEQRQAAVVFLMMLTMAFLETLGVVSIMPFMAVLSKPELVETNDFLNWFYEISKSYGVNNVSQFMFVLGVLVFIMFIISLCFKSIATYFQMRFTLTREYTLGRRFLEGYLNKPYSWFLSRNSADLGKSILSEINQVVVLTLIPTMNIIAQGSVAIAIVFLLILVDPVLSICAAFVLSSSYFFIFKGLSKLLNRLGEERLKANQDRYVIVNEAFGAAKEIKLSDLESTYVDRFSIPAEIYARNQTTANIIGHLPRFVLEAIAFGGILLVVLYLMLRSGDFSEALPIIALYAFAGYKLMPSLQQVYSSFTQLRFSSAALDSLLKDLHEISAQVSNKSPKNIRFLKSIELKNVTYLYPKNKEVSLKNVSLTIPVGSKVGFVGGTGAGKTTIVDVILGLLEVSQGSVIVDGQIINDSNRKSWQSSFGYVPQNIYLSDDSVTANIAFGVSPHNIDYEAIERVSKISNLHDFVINQLPQQYDTHVGERGVRLSGGQKQRIGIARALYHNPQVLVLDEATSALDNLTEQVVMEAVHNLGHEITTIMIAHRLATVKDCDIIFLLEKGELKAQGTYNELLQNHEGFRNLALIES